MELTNSFERIIPKEVLKKYTFQEVRSAAGAISASCASEWEDFLECLSKFRLKTEDLMVSCDRKSRVVETLENIFYAQGWMKTRVDTEQIIYKVPKRDFENMPNKLSGMTLEERVHVGEKYPHISLKNVFQEGSLIATLKGRLAVDIKWSTQDEDLDRNIATYRKWYDLGVIDGAILITKEIKSCKQLVSELWNRYVQKHPEFAGLPGPVDLGTSTTTTLEKAQERIKRGDAGGCPILLVGITSQCWDQIEIDDARNKEEIVAGARKKKK